MANYQQINLSTGETGAYSEADLAKIETQEGAVDEAEGIQDEAGVESDEERPEWLPEKFASPEQLAKAYSELESRYSSRSQDTEEQPDDGDEAPEVAERDFSVYSDEFAEHGTLSEESVAEIESWGIPREMIEGYVEGQKAVLAAQFQSVYSEAGGEESYNSMIEWAADNLPDGEQDAFNRAVMQGTTDDMMFAVRSLVSRWRASTGTGSRPLVQGSTSPAKASGSFRSLAELTAAMKDPRYAKDPAYRKDIETRLAVSDIL
jgi:uncharacterized protein YbaA (DUF1428 family)